MHNLSFINYNIHKGFDDWVLTGCYYTIYHAALALLLAKEYKPKTHDATLCLLIKEYYKEIDQEEIYLINNFFLEYNDIMFYVESKTKRREATYSTKFKFDKTEVTNILTKTIMFLNKTKRILNIDTAKI